MFLFIIYTYISPKGKVAEKTSIFLFFRGRQAPACEMVDLGCPVSSAALSEVMRAEAPRAQKRAAIMRALDYFGVDRDAIDVPTAARAAFFGPRSPRGGAKAPTVVRYEDASQSAQRPTAGCRFAFRCSQKYPRSDFSSFPIWETMEECSQEPQDMCAYV